MGVDDDGGDGGEDHDDVADTESQVNVSYESGRGCGNLEGLQCDHDRIADGLEATKSGVGDVGTKERDDVDPKRVESHQLER